MQDHGQQMSDWILAQVVSEDHGQQMSDLTLAHLPRFPAVQTRGLVAGGSPAPSLGVLEPDHLEESRLAKGRWVFVGVTPLRL